ncbi:MAG: IPExxxVDY family protein [Chitinophagaceae bacterium]
MRLVLDNEHLNQHFFEDTRLLGIIAPIKNYQFCWQLNNALGFSFWLNPDIEIHLKKKQRSYYFPVYQSDEANTSIIHYVYHNIFDGEYLLPEFKHIDYLWLIKGEYVEDDTCNWIKQSIKNINGVQLVTELTNEQIKNKGNMIF